MVVSKRDTIHGKELSMFVSLCRLMILRLSSMLWPRSLPQIALTRMLIARMGLLLVHLDPATEPWPWD